MTEFKYNIDIPQEILKNEPPSEEAWLKLNIQKEIAYQLKRIADTLEANK